MAIMRQPSDLDGYDNLRMEDEEMIDDTKTLKIEGALVFGDTRVINLIKEFEKEQDAPDDLCMECDGEGQIICHDCDGMGIIKRKEATYKESLSVQKQ